MIHAGGIERIHWVCTSPSPYNDHLFDTLSRELPAPIDFYYTRRAGASDQWNGGRRDRRWYRRSLGVDWDALGAFCSPNSLFVTCCWQDPTSELAVLCRIATGRPYLIWNDTPDERRRRSLPLRIARGGFLRMAFRNARGVMGTGLPALAAFSRMGCPQDRLVNFPCFIDNRHFTPASPRSGGPVVFGSCGRLHPIKGFDTALRALAAAFRGRFHDFKYVIAGDGPERDTLRALARELGIAERVEFLGWVSYEASPDFYRGLDIFIHPARWEPYGVAVIEAMACGLPVIATDRTAAALDRLNAGSGVICPADDVAALASAAAKLAATSVEARLEMGTAARETAEKWPAQRGAEIISCLLRPERTMAALLNA
jgi:glycosyltransferase involved in cell wall biosynthesis